MSVMRMERDFLNTETLNLAELHAHSLLYTPREARFDRITRLACRALDVPAATIGLVQDGQLWFKSAVGWEWEEQPAEGTLCDYVVASDQILVLEDASRDERFGSCRLVTGEPRVRFYAGVPLRAAGDVCVGTLALYDSVSRLRSQALLQTLRDLGGIAQKELLTTDLRNSYTQWIRRMSVQRRRTNLDKATSLWNARVGLELAAGTLAQAADERRSVGLCVLGIQFGPAQDAREMDRTMRRVSEVLVSCLRVQDIPARGDGAEFILIIDGATPARLKDVAKRIVQRLVECRTDDRPPGDFGFHFGGAVCAPGEEESAESLLSRARRALEASRARGASGIAIAGARAQAATGG